MIDEPQARETAGGAFESGDFVLGDTTELEQGWFFPCVTKGVGVFAGVIVNKMTGRTLRVMVHSAIADDLTLYDRGYQFEAYDIVVLSVVDLDQTVRVLNALHIVTLDTYYKNERVYRVGRKLSETEIRDRLSQLPAVFSGRLEFAAGELERARMAEWFTFKLFEYRGKEQVRTV